MTRQRVVQNHLTNLIASLGGSDLPFGLDLGDSVGEKVGGDIPSSKARENRGLFSL
jgi:hypothetical protein